MSDWRAFSRCGPVQAERLTQRLRRTNGIGRELFEHSAVEVLARARHAGYVAEQEARGLSPAENPSLTSWEALPESLQLSNRRYAESMATVLATLGGELVPLTGPPVTDPVWDSNVLEALARQEHQRWCDDLRADGWSYTDGSKDAHRKRHPLLVDWESLQEPDREKDRQSVRDLPSMLARLGYALALDRPALPAPPP